VYSVSLAQRRRISQRLRRLRFRFVRVQRLYCIAPHRLPRAPRKTKDDQYHTPHVGQTDTGRADGRTRTAGERTPTRDRRPDGFVGLAKTDHTKSKILNIL
jgi:hypothetical protein